MACFAILAPTQKRSFGGIALSAILRRLATAVAHILYKYYLMFVILLDFCHHLWALTKRRGDIVADMEVDMEADIEVDMVTDC